MTRSSENLDQLHLVLPSTDVGRAAKRIYSRFAVYAFSGGTSDIHPILEGLEQREIVR